MWKCNQNTSLLPKFGVWSWCFITSIETLTSWFQKRGFTVTDLTMLFGGRTVEGICNFGLDDLSSVRISVQWEQGR